MADREKNPKDISVIGPARYLRVFFEVDRSDPLSGLQVITKPSNSFDLAKDAGITRTEAANYCEKLVELGLVLREDITENRNLIGTPKHLYRPTRKLVPYFYEKLGELHKIVANKILRQLNLPHASIDRKLPTEMELEYCVEHQWKYVETLLDFLNEHQGDKPIIELYVLWALWNETIKRFWDLRLRIVKKYGDVQLSRVRSAFDNLTDMGITRLDPHPHIRRIMRPVVLTVFCEYEHVHNGKDVLPYKKEKFREIMKSTKQEV